MRLKSIKLAGFKSFVDPTTVNFPSNMCSVVGPNGCGKSNIIDAVRWVMGESSAKTLRGESMTDVIFNGTTNRQPVGQASIELLFDNSEGKIVGEYAAYSEISVRRVVGREGTSDYFLNGAKCRRRDITDLFLGTGLGPRSYAIIEQGMISRLVESKPEDLRVFIEEAAGISKYKERRRETENRMRRTVENLERLTDLREELERQLSHLQRQAQAAEKYAEYRAEERGLKAELFTLQWREYQQDSAGGRGLINDLELRMESERTELGHASAQIEQLRVEMTDATDAFNKVQADFYTVGGEVTRVEQAIRYEQEKRDSLTQDLDQTRTALSEAQGHLDADSNRLSGWRAELTEITPELERLLAESERGSQALAGAEQSMTSWQTQWEAFNERAALPRQTSEVAQSRIAYLEQVLTKLNERIARLQQELANVASATEADASIDALREQIELSATALARQESDNEARAAELANFRTQIEGLRQSQDVGRAELQELRGQHASLTALQDAARARDGSDPTATLLSGLDISARGSLFEALQVEDRWSTAVEVVLGAALTATCIDDLGAVLEQTRSGQLPQGVHLVATSGSVEATAGTLAAVVSGSAAAVGLLNEVYLADSLGEAVDRLPSLPKGASVVTPEGSWLGHGWARTQASGDDAAGVIERERLLAELADTMVAAKSRNESLEGELAAVRERRHLCEQALNEGQRELKRAVREHAELEAGLKTRLAAEEQVRQRHAQLSADLDEARKQFNAEQEALSAARVELSAALDQMESDRAEQEQLSAEREQLREALNAAREQARQARDAAHTTEVKAENLKTQVAAVEGTIERLRSQVQQLQTRANELDSQMPVAADPDAALKAELEKLLAQRLEAEAALATARQLVADKEHALRELEQRKVGVEHRLQQLQSDMQAERLKQAERQVRIETVERQLQELEADPSTVAATLPEDASEPEWQVKVERIASRITRLGPINLAAIDECARASERKEYLDAQNADLESALTTLENAIRKIDKETRTRFQETFEQVNADFSELFPKVFGGGTASLELTGDDLLDTGVSIMARPPGKKNSTIHLLSGGEKAMTAIALVFSIFRLNPAPFCMLDEVDAPLDDANVGRYARMVKEMSDTVQFIFITHNKITMEAADHLMGVTMQEPGVSRLVTVDIEEAAQLAAS